MKEKTLSDKIEKSSYPNEMYGIIPTKDVREAVKKLKDAFCNCEDYKEEGEAEFLCRSCETIKEIFGEEVQNVLVKEKR